MKSGYPAPKPGQDDLVVSYSEANRVHSDFLKIDVATALTFSGIALGAEHMEKKARNQQAARKAYDTVVRLKEKVHMGGPDEDELNRKLKRLKSELRQLGEKL